MSDTMSDTNEPHVAEGGTPSSIPVPLALDVAGGTEGHRSENDPTVDLKQDLEQTRLPTHLKGLILADLPTSMEQERLYRELQEKDGLSFEQFLDSLGLKLEPQP